MSAYITLDQRNKPTIPATAERSFLVSRKTKVAVVPNTPPAEVAVAARKPPRRVQDRDEKLAQKLA